MKIILKKKFLTQNGSVREDVREKEIGFSISPETLLKSQLEFGDYSKCPKPLGDVSVDDIVRSSEYFGIPCSWGGHRFYDSIETDEIGDCKYIFWNSKTGVVQKWVRV